MKNLMIAALALSSAASFALSPRNPDGIYPLALCATQPMPDQGYSIELSAGGFAYRVMANVSEITIAGPMQKAVFDFLKQTDYSDRTVFRDRETDGQRFMLAIEDYAHFLPGTTVKAYARFGGGPNVRVKTYAMTCVKPAIEPIMPYPYHARR